MDIEQLKEQIKVVAKVRQTAQETALIVRTLMAEWTENHVAELNSAKIWKEQAETEEAKLREMTLQVYAETGNKQPAQGVGIREIEKLIYDPALALGYAKEHGVALKLDTAGFEKMAKISELRPGFVTVEKVITATIATVLEVK